MNITTAHSLWFLPLCLLLGAAYAWWLYRGSGNGWSSTLRWTMAVLRAAVVSLLALFLLGPMVRVLFREVRKPVVVVAHDGSASLLAAGDTTAYRNAYLPALARLVKALEADHEVRTFTYAGEVEEGLSMESNGNRTDMDVLFRMVRDRFVGADLGAVVLDGDGIYNRGRDPLLAAEQLGVPVFTIALGDTTVRPDLVLRDLEHNRVTYLGNTFPVLVRVQAHHLRGKRTRVSISHGGQVMASAELVVDQDPFMGELPLMVKATAAGLQRYTVQVAPVEGEATESNNQRSFSMEVLDDRRRVLVVADAPHPDVAAIHAALGQLEGQVVEVHYADGPLPEVDKADLVVLHQVPSESRADKVAGFLDRLAAGKVPTLAVLGSRSAMARATAFGIQVSHARPSTIDAQAQVVADRAYLRLEAEEVRAFQRFPPLQVPFGQYALVRGAVPLMNQRIGTVVTEYPLIALRDQDDRRMAVVCGEGLWRWRMADHRMHGSTTHFDRLVQRLAQYLVTDADKERFRVTHAPEFAQGEPGVLTAELYNAAFEPVIDADVSIRLKDEQGKELAFAFSPHEQGYRLSTGALEPGVYTWSATARYAGGTFSRNGGFMVSPQVLERMSTVADHGLMARLAARTGGEMFAPTDLEALPAALEGRSTLAARSYSHSGTRDLVNLRWIFFLLLGLLTLEWGLRRWNGAY